MPSKHDYTISEVFLFWPLQVLQLHALSPVFIIHYSLYIEVAYNGAHVMHVAYSPCPPQTIYIYIYMLLYFIATHTYVGARSIWCFTFQLKCIGRRAPVTHAQVTRASSRAAFEPQQGRNNNIKFNNGNTQSVIYLNIFFFVVLGIGVWLLCNTQNASVALFACQKAESIFHFCLSVRLSELNCKSHNA